MLEDFRLKVFVTLARSGSFTKTANELGISQPAVSQNIGILEKSIGTPLFERRKAEIILTSAGHSFLEYAEKILYWYASAEQMFGAQGRNSHNLPVRIAASTFIAEALLPRVITHLRRVRPELGFVLLPLQSKEDADIVLSTRRSPEGIDFAQEKLLAGVADALAIVSESNTDLCGASQNFATLSGINLRNRFAVWDGYTPMLPPDVVARVAVSSDSPQSLCSIVGKSSDLVCIVPALAARQAFRDGGALRSVSVDLKELSHDILFSATPFFEGREICDIIRKTIKDFI